MLRRLVVLAVMIFATASCHVRVADPKTVNVYLAHRELFLSNGLQVVIHQDPAAQIAVVHLRYHVGSKDDPRGRAGLAHLFEHLMFRETQRTGPGDFMQRLDAIGAVEANASTTRDSTDYYEIVPPRELAFALWLEAQRMAHPAEDLDPDSFDKERRVVENEWREHYDDTPYGNVHGFALEAVFGTDHPYGDPPIGYVQDLDRVTLADVQAFAKSHYRPNNATLVVCGPFDPSTTERLVRQAFERVPGDRVAPRRTFAPVRLDKSVRLDVDARVDAPKVVLAWPAPAPAADGWEEIGLGLPLLEGDLWKRLVTDDKVAESVDVHVDEGQLGSLVVVEIELTPRASAEAAIGSAATQVARTADSLRRHPWEEYPDYRAKQMIRRLAVLETLDARAARILFDIDHHGVAEGMQDELRRVQEIRKADVGSALQHFLADAPRVTIVVSPNPSAPRAGRRR